jgi:signal transduction histidine kinase
MIASACLTLAVIYFLVWCQRRQAWADLLFTFTSAGVVAYAGCELAMMRAQTPEQFADALRWIQVPTWVIVVSLVGFVRSHLRAGRLWLAWSIFALRTLALLLNFLVGQNLNYREVTALRHVQFLGEPASLGVGISNPLMLIGQLSLLLLVIFTVDAAIAVWRRGDRRLALITGGSIVFFSLTGMVQAVLVLWRIVDMPLTISFSFLGIVVVMGYEKSRDALRAAQLADDLREGTQQMNLAAEAAKLGHWSRDLVRNEIWASESWRGLFGFAKSEPVHFDSYLARLHPEDQEAVKQTLARAIAGGGSYLMEYRMVLPSGQERWIASRGRVEFNGGGKAVRVRGVSMDITDHKQAEAETLRQRTELAHLSRVTMLGELSGSMAHELNQPLTAILSNAQAAQRFLAHENADLNEVRDILADIVEQDNRAGEVIRRLRLLLKKGEVQQLPLDLNDVVQEVLKLVRSDLVNQSVAVQTVLVPDLPLVNGDRVQLQQVLLNLVMNACDAMSGNPSTNRQLIVRTELCAGKSVRVSVADLGIGLAPDKLEQVFEPFFTTKPHGLGLGLSVCRTIITAHGGKLWAENRADGGAVFNFSIPAQPDSQS